jgi:hypothetical protein
MNPPFPDDAQVLRRMSGDREGSPCAGRDGLETGRPRDLAMLDQLRRPGHPLALTPHVADVGGAQ